MQESNPSRISKFERQLNSIQLPVLHTTLSMVKTKLVEKNFNYEQLGSLINHDPMYVFKFLAFANQLKQEKNPNSEQQIKTPKHASMLLGFETIKANIDSLISIKDFKTSLPEKDNKAVINKIEQLACRSLHCAYQAKHLAKLMHDSAADEIFLSSLMMSLAELLVWHIAPEQAQRYELLLHQQSVPDEEAQLKAFGFKFNDLIYTIAPQWQLPDLLIETLKTDVVDETKRAIICIKLADKLSRLVDFGWYYQDVYDHLDYCALVTPFSAQRLSREFHHTAALMAESLKVFYKQCSAISYLILKPGKVPYYRILSEKKKPVVDAAAKPVQVKKKGIISEPERKPKPDNSLEKASSLPTLIQITINFLFNSNKFDHVVLLLLDKGKTDLTIRIEKNKLAESSVHKKINVKDNKNLFGMLLQKPQSIFVKASDAQRYKHLLTEEVTNVLAANEFFAKAIYYKNKPIGLLYVSDGKELSSEKYSFFNKTLTRFENHLSRLK